MGTSLATRIREAPSVMCAVKRARLDLITLAGRSYLSSRKTSVQLGGGRIPAPQSSTPPLSTRGRSSAGTTRLWATATTGTRGGPEGACGVGGSRLTGTVLVWSWRSESQSSGWARAA
jgi:hypothetical protein